MVELYPRIAAARRGENPTVIRRMPSGWAVLADWQYLPGYVILLADPQVPSLNDLSEEDRGTFLRNMGEIGDVLLGATDSVRINYSILGNSDPILHAHICPRYSWEDPTLLKGPTAHYDKTGEPRFDANRDGPLMERIGTLLDSRLAPQVMSRSADDMSAGMVLWYLDLFEEMKIRTWIDGGWGVDALLGEQTRPHDDLDIMIPTCDSVRLTAGLRHRGFRPIQTMDQCDRNFVLGHPSLGRVDFHVMDLTPTGDAVYNPRGDEWVISVAELGARGRIEGRTVRCLTPEYQVRAHAGYDLQASDLDDMLALQQRFGVTLIPEQVETREKYRVGEERITLD